MARGGVLRARQFALVLGVSLGATVSVIGCLNSNDSTPVTSPSLDAGGNQEASVPVFDASGSVTPTNDAAIPADDAGQPVVDSGPPDAAVADAGPPNGSQVGLVGGGTLSNSMHYTLVGSTGPAKAPVLNSTKYQLTGGMAASSK